MNEYHKLDDSQKNKLYMHQVSGRVATGKEWHDDFKSMDLKSWFGFDAKKCETKNWLHDAKLVQVEKNALGQWTESINLDDFQPVEDKPELYF